jgi:IS5 family transposase
MREKWCRQLPLMPEIASHAQAQELQAIASIIGRKPIICHYVLQDLCRGRGRETAVGAKGMSAEQVLRAALVKSLFGFSYEALAFHMVDSQSIRRFCLIGIADKGFRKSVLQKNITALSGSTWEAIHREILGYAAEERIEKGRWVRIDCTVVESPIHAPSDSSLLVDGVRMLNRILAQLQTALRAAGRAPFAFRNHHRAAKRRLVAIQYGRKPGLRRQAYKDLLRYTRQTLVAARAAIGWIQANGSALGPQAMALSGQLAHYGQLTARVIAQTEKRVLRGEKVAAAEKVVSIFEEHTDIIVKGRRDKFYGHKVCLTGGRSNLILDGVVVAGNPADVSLTEMMLDRQKAVYGRYPLKAALDGGFASKANLQVAKGKPVKDVCFAKKRGLKPLEMCRSAYVYKRLRRFRAGIESGISWLKRSFGLDRCTWKGWEAFQSYVWSAIVAANLLTIARKQLA